MSKNQISTIPLFLMILVFQMAISSLEARGQDWQEFRGRDGKGLATAKNLPAQWDDSKNIAWKTTVPGRGWSSPVIVDDELWMTTALENEVSDEERAAKLKTASIPGLAPFRDVTLQAFCVDRESGSVRKQIDLFAIADPPLIHALNSFASPTPVIDGQYVYFSFGTFGMACVQRASGRIVWRNNEFQFDHETGPGSSPIVWGDSVIVHCDGTDQQFVIALNKRTGKLKWRTNRTGELSEEASMKKAFSTPIVSSTDRGPQLISAGANWLYGYDAESGKELWKISYGKLGFSTVPRPVLDDKRLFVCTGFMQPSLLSIGFDGMRVPTVEDIHWQCPLQVPTMPSPLVVHGLVFMVSDHGIATCLDRNSGERLWQQRLGGEFSSSPILADDKLFFCNREGEVFVIRPTRTFEKIAVNKMDSAIMATPAAVDNEIYIRTEKSIYRIQNNVN
jgi:outer membrane protein assembly factor BamB